MPCVCVEEESCGSAVLQTAGLILRNDQTCGLRCSRTLSAQEGGWGCASARVRGTASDSNPKQSEAKSCGSIPQQNRKRERESPSKEEGERESEREREGRLHQQWPQRAMSKSKDWHTVLICRFYFVLVLQPRECTGFRGGR